MADMRKYFEMNDAESHWMSANVATIEDQELLDFPADSLEFNTALNEHYPSLEEHDQVVSIKMEEFERTVEKKILEDLKEEEVEFVQKWTYAGLQIVSLITEHLISHPFVVLRRQCQVNNQLYRYHIVPISLVPVIVSIHRWQGLTCLWKGVGSILIIKGFTLAVQDLLWKLTLWPKEISCDSSKKQIGNHILLKFFTYAIVTPFYSASLVETVQSEIASERPQFLDVFKEGFRRLLSFVVPQKGRMLPIWSVIVPTAMYFIAKHFFTIAMKTGAIPKDIDQQMKNIEFTSALAATLSADIVLYPLETIVHRLHLQGTRTIIDNLDDGLSVTPILTNFEGVIDCYETTVREEGSSGLYKGFGSVVLQCLAYTSIIKLSRFVLTQVSLLFCKNENCHLPKLSLRTSAPLPPKTWKNIHKPQPSMKTRKQYADDDFPSSGLPGYESHSTRSRRAEYL